MNARVPEPPFTIDSLERTIGELYSGGQRELLHDKLSRLRDTGMTDSSPLIRNKVLNTIEILRKQTVLESRPLEFQIALTARCNLKCIMCADHKQAWDLPESVMDELGELLLSARRVRWLGGETLLSPWFHRILDNTAANPDLQQRLITNGLLITRPLMERLALQNVQLDLSIDGITQSTYERIRSGSRFSDLTASLELLRQYGKRYPSGRSDASMSFIVMRSNCHELETIVEFAAAYGIGKVVLHHLGDPGSDSFDFERENIFNDPGILSRVRGIIRVITEKAASAGIQLFDALPRPSAVPDGPANALRPAAPACLKPWQQLTVHPGGRAAPYCYCTAEVGTAADCSLAQLWNNGPMREYRRRFLENGGACLPVCATDDGLRRIC